MQKRNLAELNENKLRDRRNVPGVVENFVYGSFQGMHVQIIERDYLRDTSVFRSGRIVKLIAVHRYQDHRNTRVNAL